MESVDPNQGIFSREKITKYSSEIGLNKSSSFPTSLKNFKIKKNSIKILSFKIDGPILVKIDKEKAYLNFTRHKVRYWTGIS